MTKKKALSDLALLIRSMSKAEKRAFRLESSLYRTTDDSPKNYLRIYDELSRQADAKTDAKPGDQEYLFTLLIDSLGQQQRKSSLEIDLRDQLSSVAVMHRRGLDKKAMRLLDKLLQLSWESNSWEFGLEVTTVHMQLLTNLEDMDTFRHIVEERKKLLDALAVFHQYDELVVELFSVIRTHDHTGIPGFLKNVLKTKPPADVRSQISRHHLLAHGYLVLHDFDSTEKHHDRIQQLFEEHPLFLRMRTLQYIMSVLNSGILAWHARKINRMKEALNRLDQLPKIVGALQASDRERITRYRLDLALRCHLLENEPRLNLPLVLEINNALTRDMQMEPHRANYLRYFLALSFYYCDRNK
ncbi:MAG TPA: hypothetical protein VK826_02565, partial [Bacteroidia bacterium]|nr:hypothetical protein [Bacteroidia bacterium]